MQRLIWVRVWLACFALALSQGAYAGPHSYYFEDTDGNWGIFSFEETTIPQYESPSGTFTNGTSLILNGAEEGISDLFIQANVDFVSIYGLTASLQLGANGDFFGTGWASEFVGLSEANFSQMYLYIGSTATSLTQFHEISTPVPEPSIAVMLLGAAGILALRRLPRASDAPDSDPSDSFD